MDEYTNYNYKTGTHTYHMQTVSFIIIEGCVNRDILTLLYIKHLFLKMLFSSFLSGNFRKHSAIF